MNLNAILETIEGLRPRMNSGFLQSDKATIADLYFKVLNKVLKPTGCRDCYKDAFIEIYSFLKRNGKMKEKSEYTLKNGVVLQFFGNNEIYTNDNLTDEVAQKYLSMFPNRENLFAHVPKDHEERVLNPSKKENEKKKEDVELDKNLVKELAEKLSSGSTKMALKEEYKGYQLEDKPLTVRQLDAYLKAASEYEPEEETSDDNPQTEETKEE